MAEELFRERGYDATTVDHIAERVGMSQRTFFRHVGTKEDLVLADFVEHGEQMVSLLVSRPQDEDAWVSLRHAFEAFTVQHETPEARERAKLLWSIIESSPSLRARYLESMDSVQRRLTETLVERSSGGAEYSTLRAVVGAAFASLYAATEHCDHPEAPTDFSAELDRIMNNLKPALHHK